MAEGDRRRVATVLAADPDLEVRAQASPPIDATLPSPLSASTSLLVQAMASFGTSNAVDNSTGAVLPAGVAQVSDIVAPIGLILL